MDLNKCQCGRFYAYSEELQQLAKNKIKDATGCYIDDGWYCEVCHY